jgi:hypothetical protein
LNIIGSEEDDMSKVYTIKEAIGELEAIRMEANGIPHSGNSVPFAEKNRALSMLVAELASVMGWLTRHLDHLESEILIPEKVSAIGELKKMTKFVAKVRTIVLCKFNADNPEQAKKIASQKVWDAFDAIDALDAEIELDEIEDIIGVDDDDDE